MEALLTWIEGWLAGKAPANVWIGATICNQAEADRDVPKLLRVPAAVRFLSIEPMLGKIDIAKWLEPWTCSNCGYHGAERDTGKCMCADCGVEAVYAPDIGSGKCPECGKDDGTSDDVGGTCPSCESVLGWSRDYGFKFNNEDFLINWIIGGGESGPHARPMHPDWVRSLRDQCAEAGVPFLFKQWGEWRPPMESEEFNTANGRAQKVPAFIVDRATGHVRCFENDYFEAPVAMLRVGKKAAGRLLDGKLHNDFPRAAA